jgi:cytochrome b
VARQQVQPPSNPAGSIMVFRLFDRVSYALVMTATRPMHVLDEVSSP